MRVFIHNTTYENQRVQIKKIDNTALVKVSNREGAEIYTSESRIEIELSALGIISLEFGVIE